MDSGSQRLAEQDRILQTELDFSHLPTDRYCHVCHNLDRYDHGPDPEFRHSGSGWYNTDLDNMFDVDGIPTRRNIKIDSLVGLSETASRCRGCACIWAAFKLHWTAEDLLEGLDDYMVYIEMDRRSSAVYVISYKGIHTYDLLTVDETCAPFNALNPLKRVPAVCHDESLQLVKKQLGICLGEHSRACTRTMTAPALPRFLICLGNDKTSNILRIVDTEKEPRLTNVNYAALSYCWGDVDQFRHLSTNTTDLREQIPYERLERVCHDAIKVCRYLDVSYLWLDALCIIQDDEECWASESRKMAGIYANAVFVIGANRGSNPSVPILGQSVRNERRAEVSAKVQGYNGSNMQIIVQECERGHPRFAYEGFLQSRAWAYQERHMARRYIDFTPHEVSWNCFEATACQCRGNLDDFSNEFWYNVPGIPVSWPMMVQEYSMRGVRRFSDRLPALSGMAAACIPANGDTYLAGLWYSTFYHNMLWRRSDATINPNQGESYAHRSADRGGPSWSWASITHPVLFQIKVKDSEVKPHVELESFSCDPETANEFGSVCINSCLVIRAKVFDVWVGADDAQGWAVIRPQHTVPAARASARMLADSVLVPRTEGAREFWQRASSLEEAKKRPQSVESVECMAQCMFWATAGKEKYFLVLSGPDSHKNIFERLGMIWIGEDDERWPAWEAKLRDVAPTSVTLI